MDGHPALSHIGYDEYVLFDEGNRVVSKDIGDPLHLFKDTRQLVLRTGLLKTDAGLLVIPGEVDEYKPYTMSAEVTKRIARAMLKGLWVNDQKRVCFSDFNASNVLVSPAGKVKFTGVKVLRNLDPVELNQHRQNNINSASKIIKDDLFSGSPPPDIKELLTMMESGSYRDMYHIHSSLVPMGAYSAVYNVVHEYIKNVLPREDFRAILLAVREMPSFEKWKTEVQSNNLLDLTFSFNTDPKKGTYEVPANKDKQTRLNNDQKDFLAALGLQEVVGPPRQRHLFPDQVRMIEAYLFLEFLRNRVAHRMEYFHQWVEAGNQEYTAEGSDAIVHLRWPHVLSFLMKKLHDRGKLHEVGIAQLI